MRAAIDHPTLGRLAWDDAQRVWRGEVEVAPGRRAAVTVEAEEEEIDAALAGAARGVAWLRGNEGQARLCVADAYLDTFNRSWSEEGPIGREEFARRIELVEIGVGPTGGGPTLWYDDGGLFAGHGLSAHFDAAGQFRGANLWG
jgi:hypothetical protein